MVKILIGCPYTGLENIQYAFKELCYDIDILLAEDIICIGDDYFIFRKNNTIVKFNEINASFIRYPYDLIPPHSKSYNLREETEFYKTIALMVDDVAINKLASTWEFRNRSFSLIKARKAGCIIPKFTIYKDSQQINNDKKYAIKAIGNCFVSENINNISMQQKKFLSIEEDDGDIAAIFPASSLTSRQLSQYLSCFGHAFCQQIVKSKFELRCYMIEQDLFIYQRDKSERFDKSFSSYTETMYKIKQETKVAIRKLSNASNLSYLCFDVIVNDRNIEYVIDINPYGSFPSYEKLPEVSKALAKFIYRKAKYV